jgi:GNAT superfamily N-acetyltransferase
MSLPDDYLIRAEPSDVEALSLVVAETFDLLAPSLWLIPDEAARREIFPGYFRIYVEHAMEHGTVYTTADRAAAALWVSMADSGPEEDPGYDARLAAVTGPWIDRFRDFDATLDKHHPVGARHDHLAILAVHPDRQRGGIGKALLSLHHQALDSAGRPAYLEASDTGTRSLYLQHGYVDLDGPIRLSDGPSMYPMWRAPS